MRSCRPRSDQRYSWSREERCSPNPWHSGERARSRPLEQHLLPNKLPRWPGPDASPVPPSGPANDDTAGCIGIPPAEVGKFNQIMSLIATSKKNIKLAVTY